MLPEVHTLTLDELRVEQKQLRREVLAAEQDIAVAKISGTKRDRESAGQRKVVLTLRLSAVNTEIKRQDAPAELGRLWQAIADTVDRETADRIKDRWQDLRL